jgi:hypothetical protein
MAIDRGNVTATKLIQSDVEMSSHYMPPISIYIRPITETTGVHKLSGYPQIVRDGRLVIWAGIAYWT